MAIMRYLGIVPNYDNYTQDDERFITNRCKLGKDGVNKRVVIVDIIEMIPTLKQINFSIRKSTVNCVFCRIYGWAGCLVFCAHVVQTYEETNVYLYFIISI